MKPRKELLFELLSIESPSGLECLVAPTIKDELLKLGFNVNEDKYGNIYAVRGKAKKYPLLNAHMDIVDVSYYSRYYSKGKTYYLYGDKDKDKYIPYETTLDEIEEMMTDGDRQAYCSCYECKYVDICTNVEKEYNILCKSFKLNRPYGDFILEEIAEDWGLSIKNHETENNDEAFFVYEKDGKIKGTGGRVLGGDDKCGIFIALEVARFTKVPMKILFTVQEEEGCIGISEFIKENVNWFNDVSYSITIDRRYGNQILWSQLGKRSCSNAFAGRLALAGISVGIPIEITDGSIADVIYIRELVPEAVNISAGYYNPHDEDEYVIWNEVVAIIRWLKLFLNTEKEDYYVNK